MQPSSTLLQKAVLINNLMARSGSGTASQFSSSVTDTKGLIKETEVATTALNFFLIFISIIIMSLVMLVSSVSFSANVNENAREFAVLRSLGLLRSQTVMVWLLEAVSLTCSSFLLGTMIGLLVASSLTLTQGLFLEIPFFLVLPTGLLFVLFILSVIVALVASFQPAKLLLQKPIAGVLKG
jgi:ABC-type antimicrobial peptide transport system permease subunit